MGIVSQLFIFLMLSDLVSKKLYKKVSDLAPKNLPLKKGSVLVLKKYWYRKVSDSILKNIQNFDVDTPSDNFKSVNILAVNNYN